MKSARLALLTALLAPLALPAATPGSPAAGAEKSDAFDLSSLRAKAERGNAIAQYNLGLAYAQGRQTPVDPVEAYAWLTLAAEGGTTGKALDAVLESLSADQLTRGRRRLDALRAGNPNLRAAATSAASERGAAPASATSTPVIAAPSRASSTTPVIAVPSAGDSAKPLPDQLAAANQDKRQLAAELATAWKEVEQLQAQLASHPGGSADLAAAQTAIRDSQAALARQSTELATSRAEAAAARIELQKLQAQLTEARETIAANTTTAARVSDVGTALERERAAHAATQAALTQAEKKASDLAAAQTTWERSAGEARQLSARSAELTAKTDTLSRDLAQARTELASARESAAAATAKLSAEAEAHARQRASLEESLAAARNELTQTKAALAAAAGGADAESQLTALRSQVSSLRREVETANTFAKRVATDKAESDAALATANQKLNDAARELTLARQRSDEYARELTAASDKKIAALQAQLTDTQTRLTAGETATAAREAELKQLRTAAASAPTQPAVPPAELEAARREARDAQQRLATATQELTALRGQAATARELETRVRQLEAEKASLASRPAETGASKDEVARLAASQAEMENKLSTTLRSYTLLTQERDQLRARVAELSSKVATSAELLSAAEARTRSAAAPATATPELETARREAQEAQQQLASATRELAALRTQAATARDLELRVRQLEAEKVAAPSRPADTGASKDELARLASAQADAESKLSTALRSYSLLAQERDELRARVDDLSSKFSAASAALTSAETESRAAAAAASASIAASAELEALRIRAANAERAAEKAQAELARANQLLAGLRPPTSQPARPTVTPGQAARTHTIAPGETLASISQRYYGTPSRWPDIVAANRDVLVDERSFVAGRTLRIP